MPPSTSRDSLAALASLGRFARSRLAAATVIGITGSAGKTTTKDLLAAALTPTHRVHASPASFNNEAGVPLTLLEARDDTEVVVIEMGARFAGNITELCAIAEPQVGVITHVGMAHAGLLGGREGIAQVEGRAARGARPPRYSLSSTPATSSHPHWRRGRTRTRGHGRRRRRARGDHPRRRRRPRRRAASPLQAPDAVGLDARVPLDAGRTASRERGHGGRRRPGTGCAPRRASPTGWRVPRRRHGGWT